MSATVLELNAIQGLVLRGYRMPVGRYLYLRVEDARAARDWIGGIAQQVTTAAPWRSKPDSAVNIAFTAVGLRALGVPEATVADFSAPFAQGMVARAATLGDTGPSSPANWPGPLGSPDVHILVLLAAGTAAALKDRQDRLISALPPGLPVIARQDTEVLPGGTEHFGYVDGFSQPDIEGAEHGPRTGLGAPTGNGGWRPIRAGEFILGYPDEEGVLPDAPKPAELARNGSYLAVRKLHQDVAAFRRMVLAAAEFYPGGADLLVAKLLGRWPDGTPLENSPKRAEPGLAADPRRNNAFDYADDPDGYRCPVGAHIRRVNPRLSLPFDGKLVNRHRLVRRGAPYGSPLPAGVLDDDGADRGNLFACFQADPARQFEFIQSQWLNDGNAFRLGADRDVIAGAQTGDGKFTINGEPPAFVGRIPRLVTTVGGEYFFAPGINGLNYLSRLTG